MHIIAKRLKNTWSMLEGLKKLWNLKLLVIQIVVVDLGTVSKFLENDRRNWGSKKV